MACDLEVTPRDLVPFGFQFHKPKWNLSGAFFFSLIRTLVGLEGPI